MSVKKRSELKADNTATIGAHKATTGEQLRTMFENILDSINTVCKGIKDCSSNPDYPAAEKGDWYFIDVPGKIGGASGKTVQSGSYVFCISDAVTGDESAVGNKWLVMPGQKQTAQIFTSSEIDMKTTGATVFEFSLSEFTIPVNIYVITVDADTVTPGSIDVGTSADNTKFASATALTGHTANGKCLKLTISNSDAIADIRLNVQSASTGTTHKVKLIVEHIQL